MIHDNTILSSCNLCYHSVSVNIPQKKLTRLDDQKSWNIIISLRTLDASQRYYTITLKNIIVHVVFNWQKHPPLATTLREEPTFCTAHASFDKHRSLKAGEDPSDTKIILMSSDEKLWKSIWKSKVKITSSKVMHYLLFLFFKNLLQITLEIMLLPIPISDEQKVSTS